MLHSFAALDCQKCHLNCLCNYVPLLPAHVCGVIRLMWLLFFFKASGVFHQGERDLMPNPVHIFTIIVACFKQLVLPFRSILSGFVVFSMSAHRHYCGTQQTSQRQAANMLNKINNQHAHNKAKHVAQLCCAGLSKASLKLLTQLRATFASPCLRR